MRFPSVNHYSIFRKKWLKFQREKGGDNEPEQVFSGKLGSISFKKD
jgi:hypothetical protein